MSLADFTGAGGGGEVAHADHRISDSIGTYEQRIEEVGFAVFDITAKSIAAEVRDLHHAGKGAVDE
jgi:hypothetical protein